MGKNGSDDKHLTEVRFTDDELAERRKRVCDMLDQQDKKKLEAKDLGDRIKDLRTEIKQGYHLEEGEMLPFKKTRGSNDIVVEK